MVSYRHNSNIKRLYGIEYGLMSTTIPFESMNSRPHGKRGYFQSVSLGEIVLEGKKIIGSAQRRLSSSFLQQGSIPLNISRELHEGIFGSSGNAQESLLQIVPGIDVSVLAERIRRGFENIFRKELVAEPLTPEERHHAEEVLAAKYTSPEWKEFR